MNAKASPGERNVDELARQPDLLAVVIRDAAKEVERGLDDSAAVLLSDCLAACERRAVLRRLAKR